jgi:hypothetical protein
LFISASFFRQGFFYSLNVSASAAAHSAVRCKPLLDDAHQPTGNAK